MVKKEKVRPTLFCRDCKHAYDYHEKNLKGELFMARCPFRQWSVFLNHTTCEKLVLKNG